MHSTRSPRPDVHGSRAARIAMTGVVATAATLTLAAAPADAAPARPAAPQVAAHTAAAPDQAAAKRAGWYTLKHASKRVKWSWDQDWRRRGSRIMQVKARCWGGNRIKMYVVFQYRSKWTGWHNIKSGSRRCDGQYMVLSIRNAGSTTYGAQFSIGRHTQTIEYWAQAYG
ncbi:hypothetical protein [Actinomadura rupiterrae]|uniref:hypothetical protein n=1 Tax=Actinomadura rupiterrae TaxID=559627 RepID=UPI0020A2639F|nr:hypothetical protein [Actinomadura rupiterrae]MCP2341231.1 hypothetical protein [Actinomadura rupiterrae]